ncbi:tape measure protein [Enterobacter hormaechei]|uniref:tape measure protein n=1 Tax=Enterobacter hormaechei TaxID=158836 RepID=UPI001FF3A9DB|nr:tape measure protein [Enterobacter hormaechei]MCK7278857.1 tape measure protein [Enterobacter hormaechei]MCM7737657.1 tape measure protein [Enterobacter hormaechei]MCW4991835.1 tape measure protein [Enterobacter hormaechei subsp. xiangfangensis]MCW5042831.1 tape measure protein [Enterobacter hormaechei subsp. xiangfangensis]UOY47578.1 tape measure protein [Enterobacter hormaechei subsp. steigerwaltii]
MAQNVGDIEYVIKADRAQLLRADKQVVNVTNSMESGFKKADKSADALNTGLTKLASTLKLVIAAGTLREMARMVQSYQEMSERVQMATSSQEEFQSVQKRLLNTANDTYRSLSEAQELYITTADSLRSMGYSTQQALDVQDSMSFAFVKNATSADRANNAISAFSKSINKGKVEADSWETIIAAIPSVIGDIATASGKTTAEIRALGSAGKLTASQLTEGLKASLDSNASAAKGMSNNLTDAGVRIKTAITEILVSFEGQTSVLQTFTNGLISAADVILEFGRDSESMAGLIDTATIAAKAFALVMAGRYAGALNTAIAGKVQSVSATRQMVTAESQAAQAALIAANATRRKAVADKEAALSAVALAQAEYNVAKGSNAEMTALTALTAEKSRARAASLALAQAESAQAAATAKAASAARAASIGMGLLRGAMSLLGGPAGIVMIAASALIYWWQSAKQAKEEAINYADSLDGVIAKMKEMNQVQLTGTLADVAKSVAAQKDHIDDLNDSVRDAQTEYDKYSGLAKQFGVEQDKNNGYVKKANEWLQTLNQRKRDVSDATDKLNRTTEQQSLIQEQLNQKARESEEAFNILANNLRNKIPGASEAAISAMASTIQVLDTLNKKAASVGKDQPAEPEESPEAKKLIQNAERRLALSKLEGEARARLQAQYDAEDAGIAKGDKLVGVLQNVYAETERVTAARKDANKKTKSSDEAAQSLTRQQAALDRLNTGYADGSLELAKYDAVVALGNKASGEQIVKAEQQAESIWKIQQATKAAAEEERKRTQAGQNFTGLQGQVSPVSAVDNTYAQQMAQLDEYVQLYPQRIAEAEAVRAGIEDQYHQKRMAAMWEEWQQQSEINNMLGAAIDSLQGGATSAITGLINGTQSLQESFANIGTTILNSVVGSLVQMGIEWVKSQLMGQAAAAASLASTMAQATAAASAWAPAAMSASIATMGSAAAVGQTAYAGSLLAAKGMAVAGARYNGGPVDAGSLYRVGEKGKPEIFQASNGSQYMIPGDNGRVISNKDVLGGGGGGASFNPVMNLTINTTGGIGSEDIARLRKAWSNDMLKMMVDQSTRPGGLLQGRRK